MFGSLANRLKLFGTCIIIASIVASCASTTTTESESSGTHPSPAADTSVSETTSTTTEETSETSYEVVTEQHENPLANYFVENPDRGPFQAYETLVLNELDIGIEWGFDNVFSIQALQDFVYEATGVRDDTITLSDVNYFQYTGYIARNYASFSFSDMDEMHIIETARAVLASEGLRFGIDEIPASFFEKRFPRFLYDAMEFNQDNKALVDIPADYPSGWSELESIWNLPSDYFNGFPEDLFIDYEILRACLSYNWYRSCLVYKNPHGGSAVLQVRDMTSGKNVLVPTEIQTEEIQEDIHSIPKCEGIDIFTPETPEEFYACYGYYPDDLVNHPYKDNTPEGFEEYFNSLPESEQNARYAPILGDENATA